MKKVYLAQDLRGRNIYWELENQNSLYISGLSGSGKSFLANNIINFFIKANYEVYIISDKARVDFKQNVLKIRPKEDFDELLKFIEQMKAVEAESRKLVEDSEHTHINKIKEQKILIVLDEMWAFEKLRKEVKNDFIDLIEKLIRQGRYVSINLLMLSQSAKVSETAIPIRQAKVMIIGKTSTGEESKSLIDSEISYKAPLKSGQFIFWDRKNKPKIISVIPERISLFKKIWKFLSKQKSTLSI